MGLFKDKTETAQTPNSTTTVNGIIVPIYDPKKDVPATTTTAKKPWNWGAILAGTGAIITAIIGAQQGTTDQVTGVYTPANQQLQTEQNTRTGKNALTFVGIGLLVIVGGFFGIKYLGKK